MIRQQVFKLQSSDYWLWAVDNACTVPKSFWCSTHLLFSHETKAVSLKHSPLTSGVIFGAVSAALMSGDAGLHVALVVLHAPVVAVSLHFLWTLFCALCTCVSSRSSPETTRVYSWLALCVIGRGTSRIVFRSQVLRWSCLAWIASWPFAPCQYVNRKMLSYVNWWESVIMWVDWGVVYLAESVRMCECAWLGEYVTEV